MAIDNQALAQFLLQHPNVYERVLGSTRFAGKKIPAGQLAKFLKDNPVAANRMAVGAAKLRPQQNLNFGQVEGGVPGAQDKDAAGGTQAERNFIDPTMQGMTGGQQKGINQAASVAGIEQNANIANQYRQEGEFGGSQTVTEDAEGNVTVDRSLSPEQQGILDAENRISGAGRGVAESILRNKGADFEAGFNPTLTARTTTGDINKDRARIEDEVFNRYTKDLDQNFDRDKQKLEAELLSRGVPLTPESVQYQRSMEELNKRYDNQRIEARQRAVEKGGEEFSRSFGIGEQLRGNELNEQSGIRSQQIGEVGAFAGMGPGIRQDQFNAYDPYKLDLPDPTAIQVAKTGLRQGSRGLDINQQNADTSARSAAEQAAIARENLALNKEALNQNKAAQDDPFGGSAPRTLAAAGPAPQPYDSQAAVETAALSTSNVQPQQTQQQPAAAPVPAWSAATDARGLANQQARIEKRIAEGRALDPAEAQRRLAAVKKAQRRL